MQACAVVDIRIPPITPYVMKDLEIVMNGRIGNDAVTVVESDNIAEQAVIVVGRPTMVRDQFITDVMRAV